MRALKAWLPVVAWAAVILFASGDLFSSDNTSAVFQPHLVNVVVRKLAHVVAYGILGILTWRAAPSLRIVLLIALAIAATDEIRQSTTTTRTGSPYDVMLDVAGAAGGGFVMRRRASFTLAPRERGEGGA